MDEVNDCSFCGCETCNIKIRENCYKCDFCHASHRS